MLVKRFIEADSLTSLATAIGSALSRAEQARDEAQQSAVAAAETVRDEVKDDRHAAEAASDAAEGFAASASSHRMGAVTAQAAAEAARDTVVAASMDAASQALAAAGINPGYISETTLNPPPAASEGDMGVRRRPDGSWQRIEWDGQDWVDRGAPLLTVDSLPEVHATAYGLAPHASASDNTSALQAAISAAAARGGGKVIIAAAPTSYLINPITLLSGVGLEGVGRQSRLVLAPQNLSQLGKHAMIEIFGTEEVPVQDCFVRGLSLDGNKAAHTGAGDRYNMEVVNVKWGRGIVIEDNRIIDAIGEGIDLDDSYGCIIRGNRISGSGGFGIHLSTNSFGNTIEGNQCWENGFEHSRGGIDQYISSHNNTYSGNVCWDNYRNYHITGSGAGFTGNISWGGLHDDFTPGVAAGGAVRLDNDSRTGDDPLSLYPEGMSLMRSTLVA